LRSVGYVLIAVFFWRLPLAPPAELCQPALQTSALCFWASSDFIRSHFKLLLIAPIHS